MQMARGCQSKRLQHLGLRGMHAAANHQLCISFFRGTVTGTIDTLCRLQQGAVLSLAMQPGNAQLCGPIPAHVQALRVDAAASPITSLQACMPPPPTGHVGGQKLAMA